MLQLNSSSWLSLGYYDYYVLTNLITVIIPAINHIICICHLQQILDESYFLKYTRARPNTIMTTLMTVPTLVYTHTCLTFFCIVNQFWRRISFCVLNIKKKSKQSSCKEISRMYIFMFFTPDEFYYRHRITTICPETPTRHGRLLSILTTLCVPQWL